MITPTSLNSVKSDSKVAAIVVLYQPDQRLLTRLLDSIKDAVSLIIVVDNTPNQQKTWLSEDWFPSKKHQVIYKPLGDNYGIARAQNEGIALARIHGSDHVIFFDQDSAANSEMIPILLLGEKALLSKGINVGAVGPSFVDEKTGTHAKIIRYGHLFVHRISLENKGIEPIRADILIASGELIRLDVIEKVGLMREELFIDGVDIEWALRAAHHGYQHFVFPKATLLHSIGDDFVSLGKRKVNLHSTLRYYYSIRNHCNLILDPRMGLRFRLSGLLRIPAYILFFSLVSKNRFKTFLLLVRGCIDGFSGKLGRAFN